MHSALSVLALLLAAGAPPAPVPDSRPATVEVPVLAVDVDFLCPTRATQSLVLPPRAQGQMKVPPTCPDAGADWRVTVECPEDTCSGLIRTPQGAIARVSGTRKKLEVKPLAKEHAATLELMALAITGQFTLTQPSAEEHQRPLQVLVRYPRTVGVYTISPSEHLAMVVEAGDKQLVFDAQGTWTDDEHVHLRIRGPGARDTSVFDATLAVNEPSRLDCQYLEGLCQGTLDLWVREYQGIPLPPAPPAARDAGTAR